MPGSDVRFGRGTNEDFWLDEVKCFGSETDIKDCSHRGWGIENCGAAEAAKVICRSMYMCLFYLRVVSGTFDDLFYLMFSFPQTIERFLYSFH